MRELPLTCVLCAHMQTFDVRKICSCYENCSKLESRQGRGGGGGGVYKVGASTFREQFAVCTKIYLVQSKFEGTG